ncbi:MAG: D-amino acid aminotransferase [Methylicorpusculum sp.]|uniref:D-amino acid aminotransferase n=1 Tax=Methylicorpusculum sp. TaxID=2713644 RepID=UPI00271DB1B6|nr:D-amino acid aminotransferase [Methylicorpusculum sp.]MDO8843707.1 D-amino acid aminotransferase [Methylicorpusculum sp.]MDO8941290.1 D-amino acid aminotransferase [Methylicorpusculum sp.]MDO9240231.1 D-amino acid aminotransferase [Methylicorpusculum sp.]MDP2180200.1 D-amino acid aminotransferase [Methylicorpusculum sp.]MDP2204245.1 D-amino acid aminotransferase [Methylicorpusculum sp.]
MDTKTVYLNGEYLPLNEAKVSVLDRGFLFGDGIYEVIPAYSGRLFRLQEHLERLENSLDSIRLVNPHSREQWSELLQPLLTPDQDQYIYLQITRGVAPKRDHAFPIPTVPTVFAMSSPIVPLPDLDQGVKAITVKDNRWGHCNIKAITLLANILQRQAAIDQGCAEAILVKEDYVTEGAASNIFVVLDGVLITPPKGPEILPGITRDLILEIAEANAISYCEDIIAFEALKSASEIWLTSSTREIIPVVNLDGADIADGKPGPLWHKMHQLYQAFKKAQ